MTDMRETKNSNKKADNDIPKILFDTNKRRTGDAIIAKRKPSKVLLGLTFEIKGLLPKFLPAKNANESIKTLIKTINKINIRSFKGPREKETEWSTVRICNIAAKNPKCITKPTKDQVIEFLRKFLFKGKLKIKIVEAK
jgi:hypothetical protein